MKRLMWVVALICLIMVPAHLLAQTNYITDEFRITMRTGPGTDHKIITMLKSGQQVELIMEDEEWSMVATPNGTEGWVLSRFLTTNPPSRLELSELKLKKAQSEDQNTQLVDENRRLTEENKTMRAELEKGQAAYTTLKETYDTLKRDSADFLKLKKDHQLASAELAEKTKRVAALEEHSRRLELNSTIKWFLAGAGVLVLGFIIGFSTKRQRRRSSLL
ncbi:hypothetical protein D3OALGA1CA_5828 [Olavius algarvensis associated proteobacterium Delta 3]|nr:hypothetical protein D3OALGB2SA_1257 [Olavius algarvensis associated proteobacterium Delta 3]CAB5172382.1 hypothetical protein D3OALGA1CA_5828 [Olavius algarvensis associated proteobacterium Delta 3]